jgi:hypothetical protein
MSAQQGAPDFATQMATLTQQLTALQSKVAMLQVANATLQANNSTLTTQINALGGQPPNVQAAGGTGATATTVATPVQFATTPAMVRHQDIIDYTTKSGTLIYQEGCKALTTPFKMKCNGTVIYTTELQATSNKMGWGVGSQQITKFIKSDSNTINIIDQYGQIDTAVLQAGCKSFCKLGSPRFNQQARQNNKMMAECIMRSLSMSARICLLPLQGDFEFDSIAYALLLHKKVMVLATIDSVATTKTLRLNLREIPTYCATVKGNIELLHTYFDNNHSQIIAHGASVDDPVDILFSVYAVVPCFKFRTYIKQEQDNYTDDPLKLTHEELILLATNKYNLLVQEGKWGTISPDEEKIIAMQAELTALKGQSSLTPILKKVAGKKPGDKKNDGDKSTPPKRKKKNKENTANKRQQKLRNGGRHPPRMVNLTQNHTMVTRSTGASIIWLWEIIWRKNVAWVKNALNSRSQMQTHRPLLRSSASPTGHPSLPTWSATWRTNGLSDQHGHGGPPLGYCSWLRPVSTQGNKL